MPSPQEILIGATLVVALLPANAMGGLRLAVIMGGHKGRPYSGNIVRQHQCCSATLYGRPLWSPVSVMLAGEAEGAMLQRAATSLLLGAKSAQVVTARESA
jgi:hypothetical protein